MKIVGKIFAVLFCIIYFFLLTGFMSLSLVRNLSNGNYYSEVLTEIDLNKIRISDMGNFFDGSGLDEDATLEDAVVKFFESSDVDEEKVRKLIDNKEIREFIGNFVGDYVNYTMGGEKPVLVETEVKKVLTNPDLTSIVGEPTEEELDNMYNQLTEFIDNVIEKGLDEGLDSSIENGGNYSGNTQRNDTVVIPY